MHKLRIIGLAAVVVFAALAAYFWWPADAPQDPPPPPVAVFEPTMPPSQPPLPPLEPTPPTEEPFEKDKLKPPDEPATIADAPITSVASLTLFFFDDLAQRVVERYHPAQTEHNATDKGVLLLSLSAMNLRYGVEMIGLEHTAPSVPEAREEIFKAMLRPEVINAAWQAFSAYFLQALIDQALSAKRVATTPGDTRTERVLSTAEVSEFLQLLSTFTSRVSQVVSLFVQSDQAISLTNAWLQARSEVLSANSRYQHVIALLEEARAKSPTDQDEIRSLRAQRDAAAREIMASIKAREQIKQRLLALYKNDSLTKNMSETELLFVSQWLYRRLHKHPGRAEALALLSQRLQQFSEDLQNAAGTIQGLASE
jgi:hypothetical protein